MLGQQRPHRVEEVGGRVCGLLVAVGLGQRRVAGEVREDEGLYGRVVVGMCVSVFCRPPFVELGFEGVAAGL